MRHRKAGFAEKHGYGAIRVLELMECGESTGPGYYIIEARGIDGVVHIRHHLPGITHEGQLPVEHHSAPKS